MPQSKVTADRKTTTAHCYDSTHGVTFGNTDGVVVVDLLSEETFAPEMLTAQEVRELLGIPRNTRRDVDGF